MFSYMVPSLVVEDVGARSVGERWQAAAAQLLGCRFLRAAAFAEPGHGIWPPAALHGLGGLQPLFRVARIVLVHLVAGLRVARRIDQRGDVTAGGQDEPAVAAEQLGAAVAVLPRRDVVSDSGNEVRVDREPGQVDGYAEDGHRAGGGDFVLQRARLPERV